MNLDAKLDTFGNKNLNALVYHSVTRRRNLLAPGERHI